MDRLNAAGQPEAMGSEDDPEEGHEPFLFLFLPSCGQGLKGGQGRLLEQVGLIGCHVGMIGRGDPVDESHVLGYPLPGHQPDLLVGGGWLIDRTGHLP